MDGGGRGHRGQAGGHELQERHLCRCVLHGDPVGAEVVVAHPTLDGGIIGVVEVVEQDLLGEGEPPPETIPTCCDATAEGRIHLVHEFDGCG